MNYQGVRDPYSSASNLELMNDPRRFSVTIKPVIPKAQLVQRHMTCNAREGVASSQTSMGQPNISREQLKCSVGLISLKRLLTVMNKLASMTRPLVSFCQSKNCLQLVLIYLQKFGKKRVNCKERLSCTSSGCGSKLHPNAMMPMETSSRQLRFCARVVNSMNSSATLTGMSQ